MKMTISLFLILFTAFSAISQGYKVGDKATDFNLLNVDGKNVQMADYDDAKGFIVIFTCNHCPYSVAYEDRINHLDRMFSQQGYPVIAVNPNDSLVQPQDSYSKMIVRAREKSFSFPYLLDATQEVFKAYGATRTPHVYILSKEDNELIVRYIGAIDNNFEDSASVTEKYVESAIENLQQGKLPEPDFTKAIGCTIKVKKS
jgi:peroxiredoxin